MLDKWAIVAADTVQCLQYSW